MTGFNKHTDITTADVRDLIGNGWRSFTANEVTISLLETENPAKSAVAYIRNRLNELVDLAELSAQKVGRYTMYVASTPEITNAEIDGLLEKTPVKPMPTKTKTKATTKATKATTKATKNKLISIDDQGRRWIYGSKTSLMEHPDGLAYVDGLKIGQTGKTQHGVVFADAYFLDPHTRGFTLGSRLSPKNAEGGRVTDDKPVARYYFLEAWIRAAPRPFPPKKNEGRKWYERRGGSWVIVTLKQKEQEIGSDSAVQIKESRPTTTKAKATTKATTKATSTVKSAVSSMSKTAIRAELKDAGITVATAASKRHLALALVNHRTAKMQKALAS